MIEQGNGDVRSSPLALQVGFSGRLWLRTVRTMAHDALFMSDHGRPGRSWSQISEPETVYARAQNWVQWYIDIVNCVLCWRMKHTGLDMEPTLANV